MKTLQYFLATLTTASLACAASAQTASATVQAPPATASVSVPSAPADLSYGASQVLKLQQAGLGTDVLVNYVNSANVSFSLRADDIVYLHNAGVPQEVITAMQQKQTAVAQNATPAPAQQPVQSQSQSTMVNPPSPESQTTVVAQPPVVYSSPTYVYPSYPYYSYYGGYPYYGPSISLGFGWGYGGYGHGWYGHGWYGHGGYGHGGWGGYHGGGGWHGHH